MGQGNLRAQPFDECHTLIGINAYLVGDAVAECPNHQIVSPTRVLERVRLWVAGQIADTITRPNGDSLFAVEQRAASRHDHKNFFLKKVAVPSRRLTPWVHGLDDKADPLTPESPNVVEHSQIDKWVSRQSTALNLALSACRRTTAEPQALVHGA